jgi:uncharacterized protein YkwD
MFCAGVVALALLGQPGPAQAAHHRGAGRAAAGYAQSAYAATNDQRAQSGLDALEPLRCLDRAADRQAKAMARIEKMFHQDIGKLLSACGLDLVGENVAYGFPDGESVVRDGWMKSPPHRANILNPSFELMGLGARKGHDGRWYVSQVFGRAA